MKRCPQCGREYDNTMSFCLDDGSELLYGPASMDEPKTAILPNDVASEAATRAQIHTTDKTAVLPSGLVDVPKAKGFDKRLIVALLALAVIVGGGFFGYRYFQPAGSGPINSIAVLPFENRSSDADTDYLSDGLSESLIFRLTQLPGLRVSPTSSVMRYRGKEMDVTKIASDLGVDAVMTGRLIKRGDNLNITVELVDTRNNKSLWGEQYERKMSDLLATQREITSMIVEKLQLKLAGNDSNGITKKYTSSNEAYQLYLKGRYHWSRRTKDDILKAIDNYKKAIELDPNFALAYAATAEAYNSMGKNPDVPPKDSIPLAKAAATRSLEIDPMLAQAHAALADSLALYDWDWAGSERHFKKAIELDANLAYTYVGYGVSYLDPVGRADEAVTQLERAVALEPAAMINNCILTTTYIYARKYDKALAQGRSTYDLDAAFPFAPHWFGFALIANGKYDEAISVARRVAPDAPFGWLAAVVSGVAYAKEGKRAEAEQQISMLRELANTRYIRPYYIAQIYAALGDKDKAFAELEKSFVERDCYLSRMTVDPFMDPLRDDPRFAGLLKRMGLPELKL